MINWIKEGWVRRYFNYLSTWREHRDTIKSLNKLTDRDLKDIGLNRYDIDRLIWQEEDETLKGRGKDE
jgi:uncharacterized protein YjiS (DUF1127 family)